MHPHLLLIALLWLPAAGHQGHESPLRYPATLAGIHPGKTFDGQVIKLYGTGYFAPREGHLGGRYFTDPRHKITLHVVLGVDRVIEEVEVRAGLWLPKGGPVKQAESQRLIPQKIHVADFKMGDDRKGILARYGKPRKTTKDGERLVVKYETDYKSTRDVLFYEAEFTFTKGKLIGVRLYDGE